LDDKEFAKKATADYEDSDVDLSGYNISECAGDVNDLRKALGYDKIMLMGQSFGSQWSFAVMRHHPQIVERAILTGVEPLNHTYDMPSHIMNAIRRIWQHLDTDPAWAPYLPPGGMQEAAESVLTRLEHGGIEVKDSKGKTKMVVCASLVGSSPGVGSSVCYDTVMNPAQELSNRWRVKSFNWYASLPVLPLCNGRLIFASCSVS
jgi:hypothetical protein